VTKAPALASDSLWRRLGKVSLFPAVLSDFLELRPRGLLPSITLLRKPKKAHDKRRKLPVATRRLVATTQIEEYSKAQ